MEMDEQEEKSPTARWRTSMVFVVMTNKMKRDPRGKKKRKKKGRRRRRKEVLTRKSGVACGNVGNVSSNTSVRISRTC